MLTSEPHIGSLVRQMLIVPHHGQGQVYGAFPFVLGEKLPQIEHLSLDLRRDYYPYVHPDFFQLLSGFSTVTSLDVHRIQFPSLNDFGLLICAFPRLTNLSCWMVSWTKKTYDAGTFKALDRRLSLRSLSLRDVRGMGEMVEWLLTVTSSLQLDTISLPTVSVRDVGPVGRLLDVVGASLRHLEIGIILRASPQLQTKAVTEWEGSVGTYPRLIRNTSLTSLQIDLQGTDSDKWASWASGLLLQTAPSCVSRITILIQIPSRPTKLKQSHCGSIDGVLSLPQFCNLRQVVFQYEDGTDAERLEWFRGALPTLFPLTCARNLVRLKQGGLLIV
ncbi:uncharacterized protein FIBRA_08186 [Fibroporia radiculosa]|uniref:F-box domain-containing protein n=1 Tax=Fibroporia radiculosa TaxID=599839 RepID=J4I2C0_9APHY|nr:uncharacterized protein FIBRA_08186 [Fibroporia radiculosa]CCM05947.1 predicted protein [Fibroporia radiculosa]